MTGRAEVAVTAIDRLGLRGAEYHEARKEHEKKKRASQAAT